MRELVSTVDDLFEERCLEFGHVVVLEHPLDHTAAKWVGREPLRVAVEGLDHL